ncbi:MAG: acyl carrier protein [Clostridia bacterium]|nr:acyl carrier protein [Clostridia bacterium]
MSSRKQKKGVFGVNPDAILEKVKEVIVDQLGVDEEIIKTDTSFIDDLGADSLDIVELILALEEEFDIQIPDNEAEKISTVGDVVEYIKNNQ